MPRSTSPVVPGGPGDARSARVAGPVRRIALVVVLGSIMSIVDATIVNVALRTLSHALRAPLDEIQWVSTAYLLALAATIPATGWLTRRLGTRRLYLVSIAAFTAGSALCGLARSLGALVACRVLQGLAGGTAGPVGQVIVVRAAPPEQLNRVMSLVSTVTMLAPMLGPTLGGVLIEHAGWPWVFFVNVPIGGAALLAGWRLLPADAPEPAGRLDARGLALVVAGVTALVYGLAEAGRGGRIGPSALLPLLAGAALLAAFAAHALRARQPILDVRLFANRTFAAAASASFMVGAVLFGSMILLPLYFQIVRGEDVVRTGLLLIPTSVGGMAAMRLTPRMSERFGRGATALCGATVTLAATLAYTTVTDRTSYVAIAAATFARGFGIGATMVPAATAAFATLREDQVTDASPQLTVLQRIGGSLGAALLAVVLQRELAGASTPSAAAAAFRASYAWASLVAALAVVPCALLAWTERRAPAAREAPVASGELSRAADELWG